MKGRLAVGLGALLLVVSCRGKSKEEAHAVTDEVKSSKKASFEEAMQACLDEARAKCPIEFRCDTPRARMLGSIDACLDEARVVCKWALEMPDVSYTLETMAKCTSELSKLTCENVSDVSARPSCHPPGKRPIGAPCIEHGQCASNGCLVPAGAKCGKCARLEEGDACNGHCVGDLRCAHHVCIRPHDDGAACIHSIECKRGSSCVRGVCTAPAKVGEACDDWEATGPRCDVAKRLRCESLRCVKYDALTPLGFSCLDTYACDGGICIGGTCRALPKQGEDCLYGTCAFPFACIAGKCALPDSKDCD